MRILATADLHLGKKFGNPNYSSETQTALSLARFEALDRLVETANEEKCDLFLIAGDLFERPNVARSDVKRAVESLAKFQGHATAVLPGNHDYAAGSDTPPWNMFREEAAKTTDSMVLLDLPQRYSLSHFDLGAVLFAAPCTSRHSAENAIGWIAQTPRQSDLMHVGVAHGSIGGLSPDFADQYYPMARTELDQAGLDLWVVGHTHVRYPDDGGARSNLYVPGTPEPDGFDCTHGGTAWIIEMKNRSDVTATPLDTGRYRFVEATREVYSVDDLAKIESELLQEGASRLLVKLSLAGILPRETYEKVGETVGRLGGSLFHLQCDVEQLGEEITLDTLREEFTEGSFPYRLLASLMKDGDADAVQTAYRLLGEVRS